MSLPSLLLRVLTRKALEGATFCEDRVLDSPLNPIDVIERGATLTVYTGESHAPPALKSLMEAEWKHDLSIHMHLPSEVTINGLEINARAAGSELLFDILYRQILKALYLADNKWASLWREAVISAESLQSRPFMIEVSKGIRIAAREVIFSAQTVMEPPFGPIDPLSWWGAVIAALKSDTSVEMQNLGAMVEEGTIGVSGLATSRYLQAYFGFSPGNLASIGLNEVSQNSLQTITITTINDPATSVINSGTPAVTP